MEKKVIILRLLQYLQNEGIRVTNDFVKDIFKLIKTDKDSNDNITYLVCDYESTNNEVGINIERITNTN